MIVIQICGGLGNQMFQVALGRKLACVNQAPLKLDLTPLRTDPLRSYACSPFRLDAEFASDRDLNTFAIPLARRMGRIGTVFSTFFPGKNVVREKAFPFDPEILKVKSPAYLIGYWQTERYFADIADTIRADFQLVEPFTADRHDLLNQIQASTAVSVHVRRGDYVTNPSAAVVHGTCSPHWYAQAMTRMAERVANPKFFVFSDDADWARDNLPNPDGTVFVRQQADGRDHQDMHLMANCRHHIIANSSFSWWGAWLNPRQDKQVIAPAKWFNQSANDTCDLIPEGWEQL